MEWTLEVVVLPVSDLIVIDEADGNSWAVQEIKARARHPLIPDDHTGLRDWANR